MDSQLKDSIILICYLFGYLIFLSYIISYKGSSNMFSNILFVIFCISIFVASLFLLQKLNSYFLYENIVKGLGFVIAALFMTFFVKAEMKHKTLSSLGSKVLNNVQNSNINPLNKQKSNDNVPDSYIKFRPLPTGEGEEPL